MRFPASAYAPLGLLTVWAILPQSWQRQLVESNVRRLEDADLEWPDVVFFIERLYRLGWGGRVFLVDDNFIGNKKNVRILLLPMVEWMRDHRFAFSLLTEASLLNFMPKMDAQELLAGSRRILRAIYNPGRYGTPLLCADRGGRKPLGQGHFTSADCRPGSKRDVCATQRSFRSARHRSCPSLTGMSNFDQTCEQ